MALDFDVAATQLQWVVSGYLIMVASCFIAAGRIGDIFGRRRALIAGALLFGAASAVAGSAPNELVLIVFRFVQGAGAALLWTVGIATVTNAFPPERLPRAIGFMYTIGGLGMALGPVVGGVLAEFVTWRLVLWINVPIAVFVVVMALVSVEESRDESVPKQLDYVGLLLITGGLVVATYAIDTAQDRGWGSAGTLVPLVLGIAAIAAFALVEGRVRYPLVDMRLFRNRPFVIITAAGGVANVVWVGAIFLTTLYLQNVRGLSPAEAALVFLALSVGAAVAGALSGRLERVAPATIMAGALALGGAAVVGLSATDAWAPYVVCSVFAGLGLGLGFAYAGVGTQAVVRPERAGEASGVTMTILVSLGGVGIAVVSTALALEAPAGSATSVVGETINDLLAVVGILALVAAAVMALVGRLTRGSTAAEA